jgi:putative transposase
MDVTYVYRCRLRRAQYAKLDAVLEGQRLLYNGALQERIDSYRCAQRRAAQRGEVWPDQILDDYRPITGFDQIKSLTQIRKEDPEGYGSLPSNLSRWTLVTVDKAFKAFFSRVKKRNGKVGFPRYRSMSRWSSFGFSEFSGIRLINGHLIAKGLPAIKVDFHRLLPEGAKICSVVFTKKLNRWQVAFQIQIEAKREHGRLGSYVGVDFGVSALMTLSDGWQVESRSFDRDAAARTRVLSRKLSRAKRASSGRRRARQVLARHKRKIADRRLTYLHQVSVWITRTYSVIGMEHLQIKNMTASASGSLQASGSNVRQKAGLN